MVNSAVTDALKARLIEQAKAEGFASIGFAPADDDPMRSQRLRDWLEAGYHGEMGWMEDRAGIRQGPHSMWPEANSVIALGMAYTPQHDPLALEDEPEKARISVYAQGKDYHDIVKKALKRIARWLVAEAERSGLGDVQLKVFVDTAPVMEKPLSEAAGLGWQGKHTNLVSREHGSWLFLGAIYCTLRSRQMRRRWTIAAVAPIARQHARPMLSPHHTGLMRDAASLTSQLRHKGPIPEEFREAIGNRIYGCDDCLAVCPWNKFADSAAANRAFAAREELLAPDLANLLALDDTAFRAMFAGSPIKRIGRDRFIRNCLIAAGNSGFGGTERSRSIALQ